MFFCNSNRGFQCRSALIIHSTGAVLQTVTRCKENPLLAELFIRIQRLGSHRNENWWLTRTLQIVLFFISPWCCYCSQFYGSHKFSPDNLVLPPLFETIPNVASGLSSPIGSVWAQPSSSNPSVPLVCLESLFELCCGRGRQRAHDLPRQSEAWPCSLQFPRRSGVGLGQPFLCCYFSEVISEINCRPFSRRDGVFRANTVTCLEAWGVPLSEANFALYNRASRMQVPSVHGLFFS